MLQSEAKARPWPYLLGGLIVLAPSALAQQPALPRSAEPAVEIESLQPTQPPALKAPAKIKEPLPTRAPPGSERVVFALTGLQVTGVQVYPADTFEALYADKIGTKISLAEIYDIANQIQQKYRNDGYFLSRAIVPVQKTTTGNLRIDVIEGFVSDVRLEGKIGPAEALVMAYLENVLLERPLKLSTLERYLLLSDDLPGVDVSGVLQPSKDEVGAADLIARVKRKSVEVVTVLDNFGSSFTREWELATSVSANSFTRLGEQITVSGLISDPPFGSSKNQEVIQLSASFRPGTQGLYFQLFGSYGDSNPGGTISQFNFSSEKFLARASLGYPFVRSRTLNVAGEIGFDYVDTDTDVFGNAKFSQDRLRVLHLTVSTDFRDAWRGSNLVTGSLRQGLPILNASRERDRFVSRAGASGTFTSFNGSVLRLQPIVADFALFAKVAGQYAFDDVLSDEEFDIGGTNFGRGYDPKELSGDHGVGLTAELQYTIRPSLPKLDNLQIFTFYDLGKTWDRATGVASSLASTGGGVRLWFLNRKISFELQIAKPLTRDSQRADNTRDAEVLFRALARF